jgi:hypothetical protein
LATFEELRIPQRRGWQRYRLIHPNERQIRIRVIADKAGVQIPAIGGRNFEARSTTGNMTVGEDQAIRRNNDAGAAAAARLARPGAVDDGEPDYGRADPLDDIDHRPGIGIKERLIVCRNGRLRAISLAAQGIA